MNIDETDSVEDHILLDRLHDGPQRVGAVRRTAVRLHRQLSGLHVLFRRFAETQSGRSAPDAVKAAAMRLLQESQKAPEPARVVFRVTDSGLKYLSTDLWP